jgi:Na+/melibiose symporter-like transporter
VVIEDLLYKQQGSGASLMELMKVRHFKRYILTAIIAFLRFNLFNDMIMYYGQGARKSQTCFVTILVMSSFGQIIIGYVVMKVLKGRNSKFYVWLELVTIPFDVAIIVVRYMEFTNSISYIFTLFCGFLSFTH